MCTNWVSLFVYLSKLNYRWASKLWGHLPIPSPIEWTTSSTNFRLVWHVTMCVWQALCMYYNAVVIPNTFKKFSVILNTRQIFICSPHSQEMHGIHSYSFSLLFPDSPGTYGETVCSWSPQNRQLSSRNQCSHLRHLLHCKDMRGTVWCCRTFEVIF